eukprot:9130507-Pyramimonas_sp.AAC.1
MARVADVCLVCYRSADDYLGLAMAEITKIVVIQQSEGSDDVVLLLLRLLVWVIRFNRAAESFVSRLFCSRRSSMGGG